MLSGEPAFPKVPDGSVNSTLFLLEGDFAFDMCQMVAERATGGGPGFPGTLKLTLALQKMGSSLACTAQV